MGWIKPLQTSKFFINLFAKFGIQPLLPHEVIQRLFLHFSGHLPPGNNNLHFPWIHLWDFLEDGCQTPEWSFSGNLVFGRCCHCQDSLCMGNSSTGGSPTKREYVYEQYAACLFDKYCSPSILSFFHFPLYFHCINWLDKGSISNNSHWLA